MDDTKLITLMQQHDELYNKFNPAYKCIDRKKAIWSEIARQLGTTDRLCIRRWTSLRDRYTKECRRVNSPAESGIIYSAWHYFDMMHFLKPHIITRAERKSMKSCPDPLDMASSSIESSEDYKNFPLQPAQLSPPPPDVLYTPEPASPTLSQYSSATPVKKRKNSDDVDACFFEAVEVFKKMCKSREPEQSNETIRGFGQMILSTISSMSEKKQVKAMQRVTEVVMALKLEPEDE